MLGSSRKTRQSLYQGEDKVRHMVGIKVAAQYIRNTHGLQVPSRRSKENEMKDCFSNIRKKKRYDSNNAVLFGRFSRLDFVPIFLCLKKASVYIPLEKQ